MKKTIKDYFAIAVWIIIIGAIVLGYLYGPEELKTRMFGTGLIALITGVPALIYNKYVGRNVDAQDKGELELSDDKWANDRDYGYTAKKAITVKNIDDYLSEIITGNGAKLTWEITGYEETMCENYNSKETKVDIVQVSADGARLTELYFVQGCKECSNNIPSIFLGKRDEAYNNLDMEPEIAEKAIKSRDETIAGEMQAKNTNKEIPYDSLKKLKDLYEAGVLTDEEYSEKKKKLLNI